MKHLLGSLVEHLALCGESVGPVYKIIELLATFQHGFNGLMLYNTASISAVTLGLGLIGSLPAQFSFHPIPVELS